MLTSSPIRQEIPSIFIDIARYYARKAEYVDKSLPRSMDSEDAFHDAIVAILEEPGKPKAYWHKVLPFKIKDKAQKLWVNPGSQAINYYRKKGRPLSYGEFSLEVIAKEKGRPWEEFIADAEVNEEDCEVNFFNLTLDEATECLKDIRKQIKENNDFGISWAKTRNKWHTECRIKNNNQFIGQFERIEDARMAKRNFLESFMDAILESIDSQ